VAGVLLIFALAAIAAVIPALVDRWALQRGASPEALAALATVTLVGVATVPVTFTICTATLAAHDGGRDGLTLAAMAGLLLVAVAAGRAVARMVTARRRWSAIARIATAFELREESGGVKVLPVGELLAFTSGTDAFVSEGLIERLTPEQRRAVLAHEREHADRRHPRLSGAARALSHGAFGIAPARRAASALDRELDALADQAAVRRLGDASAVREALYAITAATSTNGAPNLDDATRARLDRLMGWKRPSHSGVDGAVRLVTLVLGAFVLAAICLSVHVPSAWLGIAACALLVVGFFSFTRPTLKPTSSSWRSREVPDARSVLE
jgi:Zn-dependent protease with chaperone function